MKVNVRHDDGKVLVNLGDRVFLVLEPKAAFELAAALNQVGKLADEIVQAPRIARDSAMLMRAGAPFTLTRNLNILDLAKNVASWDRDLRRFMPGIKSEEVVGSPTLIQEKPNGKG
jgi:hypothetical protein